MEILAPSFSWRLRFIAGAVLAWCLGWIPLVFAETPSISEYQVKAAFLINFPKYVEWADSTFAAPDSPIIIVVLGETQITAEIQKMIAGRKINGRAIVVKQLASGEEPGICQIVFIPAAEHRRLSSFSGVLTVGESDNFLGSGGIINLAQRNQKISLEVNLEAATKARLKISSKLLSVALVAK